MKRTLACLLALLLPVLAMASCRQKDGPAEESTGGEELPPPSYESAPLSGFVLLRADNASEAVVEAVVGLNRVIRELTGQALPVQTDLSEPAAYEIAVGETSRAASANLSELGPKDYIIETVPHEGGAYLVIGGGSDEATVLALREFAEMLKNLSGTGGVDLELPQYHEKGSTDRLVLDNALLQSLTIIYPDSPSDELTVAIKALRQAIASAIGKNPPMQSVSSDADLSQYPCAVVVGAVGEQAAAMQASLPARGYAVRVQTGEEGDDAGGAGLRIWLVGKNNMATLRAVQYFYSKAVVNGSFVVPKYLDTTVTALYQRDPCILPYEGKYYLYCAYGAGYGVRVSENLLEWTEPAPIFQASDEPGFDGDTNFWAPECHLYKGRFYLFATYHATGNNHRGVAVFRSDTPTGQFRLISKRSADAEKTGHITPADWDAIDGTLYVDEAGQPWMVFVYEWTSTPDGLGRMAYAPLSDDLTHLTAEPQVMFRSDDPAWSDYKVTDGPWMYRCADGTLLMIWSNMGDYGYAVGIAKSSNGRLDGEWTQVETPLFTGDRSSVYSATEGGHGMIFTDFGGRMYLAIHTPNSGDDTALTLIPLVERDGMLYQDVID